MPTMVICRDFYCVEELLWKLSPFLSRSRLSNNELHSYIVSLKLLNCDVQNGMRLPAPEIDT